MDRLECTCREGIQSKIVENGINVIEIKGNEKRANEFCFI